MIKLALHFPTLVKEKELDILDQWKNLLYVKESLKNQIKWQQVFGLN